MSAFEVNFDGLVGPTHHYGGLSPGNLASQTHRLRISFPKRAALEGLAKMKRLADLGIPQAVLPPHERPDLPYLRRQGFSGSDADILRQALRERPDLFSIAASASAMWAANAATVCPSADTADERVQLTPANLIATPHRALEPPFTTRLLRTFFADERHFVVHDPLPDDPAFADEGAANHLRIAPRHEEPGLEIFVYGRDENGPLPRRYPARQALAASRGVARQSLLNPERTWFVQQNPEAINAGVFHNDVIALANQEVLLCHTRAFVDQAEFLQTIRKHFAALILCEITDDELTLDEAVATYLFNSQVVTLPSGGMTLFCPVECRENPRARAVVDRIVAEVPPIESAEFVDVRQSMQNGGGPACLRLRVVLNETELAALPPGVILTHDLANRLTDWIERHYRDELTLNDLGDPQFADEVRNALQELSQILQLGPIYPFQQA